MGFFSHAPPPRVRRVFAAMLVRRCLGAAHFIFVACCALSFSVGVCGVSSPAAYARGGVARQESLVGWQDTVSLGVRTFGGLCGCCSNCAGGEVRSNSRARRGVWLPCLLALSLALSRSLSLSLSSWRGCIWYAFFVHVRFFFFFFLLTCA